MSNSQISATDYLLELHLLPGFTVNDSTVESFIHASMFVYIHFIQTWFAIVRLQKVDQFLAEQVPV